MRIATLQFAPSLGAVDQNIQRANTILEASKPERLDLLVLPELAFTGYNFPSLSSIEPYLEPTTSGTSTKWAIETARRLGCYVIVGYPEECTEGHESEKAKNFNSVVVVNSEGAVVANYRKSFLYYTDETWATEGHVVTREPFHASTLSNLLPDQGRVGMGICMDINPYQFSAPWTAYEFAHSMIQNKVRLVVLSMAWLTRLGPEDLMIDPERSDMETVAYWLERFYPLINPETAPDYDVTVVFANRCGIEGNAVKQDEGRSVEVENGVEVEEGDRVCYAGSSCVMHFSKGNVRMFEKPSHEVAVMGKSEEGLLVVSTDEPARFLMQQKVM